MAFLRALVRSVALVGLGSACLQAQARHAPVIAAPQGRPRIAYIVPPPPPQQMLTTYSQTVFSSYPVIVTADGRVLIDIGNGYEQVARTCPYAYGYGCQSYGYPIAPFTPIPPSYGPPLYVPPQYAPPAYGPPVYPTPSYPPAGSYPAGGYGAYPVGPQAGYVPPGYPPTGYTPPTSNSGVCPRGYVPTGSYPPCIDPSLAPVSSAPMPSAAGTVAGRRPAAAGARTPRVVRR